MVDAMPPLGPKRTWAIFDVISVFGVKLFARAKARPSRAGPGLGDRLSRQPNALRFQAPR